MARDDELDEDGFVDDDASEDLEGEDGDDYDGEDLDAENLDGEDVDAGSDLEEDGTSDDDEDVEVDDEDVDEDEDDADADGGDEDDEEEQSLDVLLAREAALDEDDLGRLDDETRDTLSVPNLPIGEGEFTCRSCFLVKRRAQLADEERLVCLDCA